MSSHVFTKANNDLLHHTLSFLDVVTLVQKKQVCKTWQTLCTQAIDNKCTNQKKITTNEDLLDVVSRYCEGKPSDMEDIAKKYRFPIGKFDVSELDDFSCVFEFNWSFNEDINAWDVSKAKSMKFMFSGAYSFNKPLDQWNTSSVETMYGMFCRATSFNQSLHSWDLSNVEPKFMIGMLYGATSFDSNNLAQGMDSDIVYF